MREVNSVSAAPVCQMVDEAPHQGGEDQGPQEEEDAGPQADEFPQGVQKISTKFFSDYALCSARDIILLSGGRTRDLKSLPRLTGA